LSSRDTGSLRLVARIDHFSLSPHQLAVRDARVRVRAFDDLPPETTADAELVVSELVANSLLHARLGPLGVIEVTLERHDDRLSIVVDDHGRFSRRPRGTRGLGFRVLDALCEEWTIETGRVTATMRVGSQMTRHASAKRPRRG
jgi:two-component sensor histidine kinase